MKTAHFDVDKDISPYLIDDKYEGSINNYQNIDNYDCISIKSSSKMTQEILKNFTSIKLIITRTVGYDHIDLKACKEQNIAVYHLVDYGSFNIAEHAFALLLAGTHNIVSCQKEIKKGIFSYNNWLGYSLQNKKLGVIGTGRIGLEFIKRAKSFGLNIVAYDVYKNEKAASELEFTYVSLEDLLLSSDIISLHAPLLPETKHMINENAIEKMKDGVILINTGRGELIDTNVLIKHISKFRFIGLDVLENEAKFSILHPLLKYDNVLITPHIGFFTDASIKKIAEETYICIENFTKGIDVNRIA